MASHDQPPGYSHSQDVASNAVIPMNLQVMSPSGVHFGNVLQAMSPTLGNEPSVATTVKSSTIIVKARDLPVPDETISLPYDGLRDSSKAIRSDTLANGAVDPDGLFDGSYPKAVRSDVLASGAVYPNLATRL